MLDAHLHVLDSESKTGAGTCLRLYVCCIQLPRRDTQMKFCSTAEVLSACASDRFETSDEQTPSRQGNGA